MAEKFEIIPASESDTERFRAFLKEHFNKGEPLNIAAGTPSIGDTEQSTFPQKILAEGLSLMAIKNSDKAIIGVCLNKCKRKGYTSQYKDDKIGRFLSYVESSVDVFDLSGTDQAFNISMLAVSEASRGTGVGKALMEHSRNLARSQGYPLLYVLCTSYFTARIAYGMGMQCVYTLPYAEYKDEQGNPVLLPPLPHKNTSIFVQKL